jgi:hypothetical protein
MKSDIENCLLIFFFILAKQKFSFKRNTLQPKWSSLFSQVLSIVPYIFQFYVGNKIVINFVRCFWIVTSHLPLGLLNRLWFQDFKTLKKIYHFTHTHVFVPLFDCFNQFNDIRRVQVMKLFVMLLFSSSLYFKVLLGIVPKSHKPLLTERANKIIYKWLSPIQK